MLPDPVNPEGQIYSHDQPCRFVTDKVALGEVVHTVMFSHVSYYSSGTYCSLFLEVGVMSPFETAVPQVLLRSATKTENQEIKENHTPLLVILEN
jgi:uncharacterized protein (DUF2342 family)